MVLVLVSFAIHNSFADMFVTGWESAEGKVAMLRGGDRRIVFRFPVQASGLDRL